MEQTHPTTALLARNLELLRGPLLLYNPPEMATVRLALQTIAKPKLHVVTTDFELYSELQRVDIQATYNTDWTCKFKFEQALLSLPKSDAEVLMTLSWLNSLPNKATQIGLIGQNNAGIKSAKKVIAKLVGPVTFTDNARHSAFYLADQGLNKAKFNLEDWWKSFHIPIKNDATLTLYSLPGVFSHGRLDEGTDLLLKSFHSNPLDQLTQNILDWGSGSGVVGLWLKYAYPTTSITLADSSALAVTSARKNVEVNHLVNCKVVPTHLFSNVHESFDYIVANPPFHKGRDTHYADTESFLSQASTHLPPSEKIRIVANNFLRYEQFLKPNFQYIQVLSSNTKYKIIEAIGPKLGASEKRQTRAKRPQKKNDFHSNSAPTKG